MGTHTPIKPGRLFRLLAAMTVGGLLGVVPVAQADQEFVVLGQEGVWLKQSSAIVSGDVGVNTASAGPFLASGVELTLGIGVDVLSPTIRIVGDSVKVKQAAQVYDVLANDVTGNGQILGQVLMPLNLPVVPMLPPIPAVVPGTEDVQIPLGGALSLPAGRYGLLKAKQASTITLTGGDYHFSEWRLGVGVTVHVAAPSEIHLAGRLKLGQNSRLVPAPGTALTAGEILLVVTGINGATGTVGARPKAATFGIGTTVRAKVYAPNGTLWFKQNTTATGAFLAKWVVMGIGTTTAFEGGFGVGVGSGGNTPPVADAGPDQTVHVAETVHLDGSGSTDVDGDALTYAWTILSHPPGSTSLLDDPSAVMPVFVVDAPGTYAFQLIVNDGTVDSDPDTVSLTTINSPPVADAGPDQTVFLTQPVVLDGTGSHDVDGDPLTFLWSFVSRPNGSMAALSDPASPTPDFVVDRAGTYVIQLLINDGTVDSDLDLVMINTQNSNPVADAGPDQTVPVSSTVVLDGSGSSDADGDPLTFQWSLLAKPVGSTATLSDPTANQPAFVADLPGLYVAQLIVNDGAADSAPDTVTITTANTPPAADAGPDQSVPTGVLVQLDGNGSSDPDGDVLTFQWTILQQPLTSAAVLSDPTLANPTFLADRAGPYRLQLIVNDGAAESLPDTVTITAANAPPTLDPVGNQTVLLGHTLTFTLTGSDPNGDALSFSATPLPLPEYMTINGTTGVVTWTPAADQVGQVVLTMMISDGLLTDTEPITLTVQGAPPGGITGLTGRLLDTTDFSSGQETPVVGATVSFVGTGLSTISDASGFFTLLGAPPGIHLLEINGRTADPAPDGSAYAVFRQKIELIPNVTTVENRPFFLPRIDPASRMTVNGNPVTGMDPQMTTIVTNPVVGVTLTVPPHTAKNPDGTDYTGPLSISEVPGTLAPTTLPKGMHPGLLIV